MSAGDATAPRLVLASRSPRRAEILSMLRLEFRVDAANVPEAPRPGEPPDDHVIRLATEKAAAVGIRHPESLVLAGDTVVVHDGQVMGKPDGADDAAAMLELLSGRTHTVLTGMAVREPDPIPAGDAVSPRGTIHAGTAGARVTFRELSADEIRSYVDTGEPLDKAGAYGIQELGASLVASVEGDYYAVVGLSVACLHDLLSRAGYRMRAGRIEPVA